MERAHPHAPECTHKHRHRHKHTHTHTHNSTTVQQHNSKHKHKHQFEHEREQAQAHEYRKSAVKKKKIAVKKKNIARWPACKLESNASFATGTAGRKLNSIFRHYTEPALQVHSNRALIVPYTKLVCKPITSLTPVAVLT
jgi:hypothetical protein